MIKKFNGVDVGVKHCNALVNFSLANKAISPVLSLCVLLFMYGKHIKFLLLFL